MPARLLLLTLVALLNGRQREAAHHALGGPLGHALAAVRAALDVLLDHLLASEQSHRDSEGARPGAAGPCIKRPIWQTGRAVPTNTYETRVHWTGSTGLGWEHYDRTHVGTANPAEQEVRITTGESKGDPSVLNPEQLVLMAASSCQMLWFLHLAAKARIDVVEYEDSGTALMPTDREPVRITEITPAPAHSRCRRGERGARPQALLHGATEHCFVANSLNSQMSLQPTVEVRT